MVHNIAVTLEKEAVEVLDRWIAKASMQIAATPCSQPWIFLPDARNGADSHANWPKSIVAKSSEWQKKVLEHPVGRLTERELGMMS